MNLLDKFSLSCELDTKSEAQAGLEPGTQPNSLVLCTVIRKRDRIHSGSHLS